MKWDIAYGDLLKEGIMHYNQIINVQLYRKHVPPLIIAFIDCFCHMFILYRLNEIDFQNVINRKDC